MFFNEQIKISRILNNYCKNNRYADEKFINFIVEIILKLRRNKGYVNNLTFGDGMENGNVAFYNYMSKELSFVLPEQNMDVIDYNLMVLHFILHECEHITHHKLCNNNDKSLRGYLLRESMADTLFCVETERLNFTKLTPEQMLNITVKMEYFEKRRSIYPKIYEFLPAERMAEIDSFERILNILEYCKFDKDKSQSFIYARGLNIIKLLGYSKKDNEIMCPTYSLYYELDKISPNQELLNKIIANLEKCSNNLDLDDRLYYGLPITDKEHEYVLKKII